MASPESRAIRATFTPRHDAPDLAPAVGRQQWEDAVANVPLPTGSTVTPVDVAGMTGEWISSPTVVPNAAVLLLHGGGYSAGSCITHRELAARLCLASGLRVLLVNYRLAPEHPAPTAVEDAATAYQWLLAQGLPPTRIIISGDSAGGGLAVATLLWLRDQHIPLPAASVLLSPWLDLTLSGPSMDTHATIDPLTSRKGLQRAATWYAGTGDPAHPLASPLYGALHDLPPFLIHVGSDEVLLSDSTRFAAKARASGVEVTLDVWEEMWHVWHMSAGTLPEGQQAIEQIGTFIRAQLATT